MQFILSDRTPTCDRQTYTRRRHTPR